MMNKIKAVYKKIAPPIAKISRILLVIALLALVAASLLTKLLEDSWHVYYAAVARMILKYASIVLAALYCVFDLRNLWMNHIRKGIVSLKRQPSMIPLAMLFVSFLLYSLNLTDVSDTTAKIQGAGMGLSQFSIMLFSLLSMVCMLNSFPRRKKPNIPMLVIMFVMFAIIIFCDITYRNAIFAALYRPENPIVLNKNTEYIADAYNMLGTHMVLVCVTAALVVLMPLYSKLLRMIKTSIAVEDNGSMEKLELND